MTPEPARCRTCHLDDLPLTRGLCTYCAELYRLIITRANTYLNRAHR